MMKTTSLMGSGAIIDPPLVVTMTLKVQSSNTIYDIVTMIKDKLGIPQYCRHMLLVHGEEVVNEKSSLNDCHIEMGSTLFFVVPMQEILAERQQEGVLLVQDHEKRRLLFTQKQLILQKLFKIENNNGKTFVVESKTSDTIIDVRIQIQRKLHIPICMQKLFFAEEEIEDDFTLVDSLRVDERSVSWC
ncbi:zinc finger, CCHC-type containing protein [Tanacetum coccineum]